MSSFFDKGVKIEDEQGYVYEYRAPRTEHRAPTYLLSAPQFPF